jgi:hypothetical protein
VRTYIYIYIYLVHDVVSVASQGLVTDDLGRKCNPDLNFKSTSDMFVKRNNSFVISMVLILSRILHRRHVELWVCGVAIKCPLLVTT